jgi:exonuclease III
VRIPFLFWNLQSRELHDRVAELAVEHDAQIIVLAECSIDPGLMIKTLTAAGMQGFTYPPSPAGVTGDIRIFVRFPKSVLRSVHDDVNNHLTIRRLVTRTSPDILLVAVHSQSKRNWSGNDQTQGAFRLSRIISEKEARFRHRRTLLVGDLNMNPFEEGVVGSEGLHAVMTKRIAAPGSRVVDAEDRPFFYNPMWRFFGERRDGPPGTHYYPGGGKPITYFWNIFDQVLVRPDLMNQLNEVRILDQIGEASLLDAGGIPDRGVGSDHLPLFFVIDV